MRHPTISFAIPVLIAAFTLPSPAGRAQSYGPDSQVRTVGAAEFRSLGSADTYIDSGGYLRYNGEAVHLAPLSLPDGALIEKICVWAHDSGPDVVQVHLVALKLVPGGEGPGVRVVGPDVFSLNLGYAWVCKDVSETLRGNIDVDGDGSPDSAAYYVHAYVPSATQNVLGLGGVRIFWRRQVSDPPSTPTFGDVPASDPAFPFIEALESSEITAGCAGGNYCPDASLTRRQMAVFLAKALGLHWAD